MLDHTRYFLGPLFFLAFAFLKLREEGQKVTKFRNIFIQLILTSLLGVLQISLAPETEGPGASIVWKSLVPACGVVGLEVAEQYLLLPPTQCSPAPDLKDSFCVLKS